MPYNSVSKIREHYDLASPYYQKLWGNHIHHGYWETGRESKEEAAENLIRLLLRHAKIPRGSKVLDVGCGVGGTSIWLTKNLGCKVTGITISPVQVKMASEAAAFLPKPPQFFVKDANSLDITEQFDVILAIEMISHLKNRGRLFKKFAELLPSGGKICITDWLRDASDMPHKSIIEEIEKGMLVDLPTVSEYNQHIKNDNLRLVYYEDISRQVAKTWDVSLGLVKDVALWKLATEHGKKFVEFLKSFKAMRQGFKTGVFRYGAMIIEKP